MQRPNLATVAIELNRVEQAVHGASRGFVGALHRREIGVCAHVVRRQEQVGNRDRRFGSQLPGVDQVHKQRFGILEKARTRVVFADVRIKKPGMKVLVAQQFRFAVDGTLELFPSLAGNLLASALHRRVSVRSRSRPVGDIDGEYVADLFVADLTEHNAFPELDLRDTGQRPGRIDMNDVSMGGRQVRAQVELQAVHPLHVRRQGAQIGKRGIGGEHLLVDHGSDALERQRGHVVIAAPHFACAIVVDGNAGNPSCVAEDRFDLRLGHVPHAPRLEIVAPGIDPRQIGRSVQHAIGRPRRGIEHRQHHLHEHIADCAGAGFSRLGGHQRAREPRR